MIIDTTFPHTYQFRLLTELPNSPSLPRYYYPGASPIGGSDGIVLEIQPEHGERWFGIFAFGRILVPGVSGIFTTPQSHRLCVVTQSEGFLVSSHDPTDWEVIHALPIRDVYPIHAQGLLVFYDFIKIVAYGETSLKWRTKQLVLDDLHITEVTDNYMKGEGDAPRGTVRFSVDLATGSHEGGLE